MTFMSIMNSFPQRSGHVGQSVSVIDGIAAIFHRDSLLTWRGYFSYSIANPQWKMQDFHLPDGDLEMAENFFNFF